MGDVRTVLAALCLTCVLASGPAAQTYTVHATDPLADYQDLKTAIASVPAGSVLLVLSDLDDTAGQGVAIYSIDKDLSILGDVLDARPVIQGGVFWINSIGAGPIEVELRHVESTGAIDWHCIEVYDQGKLTMESVRLLDGAIDHETLRVYSGGIALLNDCELFARGVDQVAADGVRCWGTTVLSDTDITMTQSPLYAIRAVDNGAVYRQGGAVNGTELVEGSGLILDLSAWPIHVDPLVLGQSVTAGGTFTAGGLGAVFYGLTPSAPVDRNNPFLLGPGFALFTVALDGWSLTGTIPDLPALLGIPVYVQQFDLATRRFSVCVTRVVGNQ